MVSQSHGSHQKFFEEVNDGGDKIVDEYTYVQYLDPAVYKERMVKHWDTSTQRRTLRNLLTLV